MKIAIIHDYIKEYGGAERVLEALHEIWPEAPVYTTFFLPEFLGPHKKRFEGWNIVTSMFQKIPYAHKMISPLRLLSPWVFENWDFTGFDVIITSATGAYFPNLIVRKPGTLHICYCHTPPRYLYGYPTARNWKNNPLMRLIGEYFNVNLRQTDFLSAQRPDYFIANSIEVKRRIWKFYRRDARVIYPPVDIKSEIRNPKSKTNLKSEIPKKGYYLTGGRLARAKHIDLAIEACNSLQLPLKVFGKPFADYGEELKKIAGSTTEFVGEIDDKQLNRLYIDAKALIYPSEYEDFGIIPVEAQGVGIPVIAYKSGGVTETVIDGKTGVFFDELTRDSIIKAIMQLSNIAIKPEDCINNAKRFSRDRFKKEIKSFINTSYARTS
jgi:glycosyltransferase involved in cell wall biosynthesis